MSKNRKVYPALRPPVEDEPERPKIADARATEAARRYRCPSHGRSGFATAAWDNGWRIEGVCCADAEAAIIAGLDG
jgi:hypothetical protein